MSEWDWGRVPAGSLWAVWRDGAAVHAINDAHNAAAMCGFMPPESGWARTWSAGAPGPPDGVPCSRCLGHALREARGAWWER